ncbi:MAG: di-heme oxidoredictase family protein [Imperialibacter sp.]|uniref:di-heme oxidoredictase family protein n=1 Tax=Imperialibacter sp. TaxID=2038411 RepID=UPI0032EE0FBC
MQLTKSLCFLCLLCLALSGCQGIIPEAPEENTLLDGPVEGLSNSERKRFLNGDFAFNAEVFSSANGLGPLFVATSCGSCHAGDGKGHPFTTLTRFGQSAPGINPFIGKGGPQLQNRAVPGYEPEQLPDGVAFSRFTPPANTGLGFLEALTDAQILANADPDDSDGDGISGVPNYITPPSYFQPGATHTAVDGKYIGRFGKKAAAIDLLHQTVNAYNQDIGVTTTFEPVDPHTHLPTDPEVSDQVVHDLVFYLQTLKEPIPRASSDADVVKGKALFSSIGCANCHIQEWTTPETSIKALSNKKFYPYTDLLLHDMGPGLDDGYTEGSAETYEWRTPPLWGLGLSPNSQGGNYFLLHDGRAKSIEEAILLHGGEGQLSKTQFELLTKEDKDAILKFLKSL